MGDLAAISQLFHFRATICPVGETPFFLFLSSLHLPLGSTQPPTLGHRPTLVGGGRGVTFSTKAPSPSADTFVHCPREGERSPSAQRSPPEQATNPPSPIMVFSLLLRRRYFWSPFPSSERPVSLVQHLGWGGTAPVRALGLRWRAANEKRVERTSRYSLL